MTTLMLKIESASSSLTARYSTILALQALCEAGLVRQSYVTRYINKNVSRQCAIAHIRKYAKFGCKLVATNGNVNRYEVYLQFDEVVVTEDNTAPCFVPLPANASELDAQESETKRLVLANNLWL